MRNRQLLPTVAGLALAVLTVACGTGRPAAEPLTPSALPAQVPTLPFADNLDPTECGIPTLWGADEPAWLTGSYQGRLIQPVVYLYDSHARTRVVGQIPHGGRVRIELNQANPTLDYYRVRSLDLSPAQEGWVPASFVSFTPPPA